MDMRKHESRTAPNCELLNIPGFRGCSAKQLAEIDRLTDRSTALPGRVLVREGMIGRELYVILSGTATVTRRGRLLTTLGPGDYFGELAAIDTGHRNATLTAISSLTVLIIGPREFSALMADISGFRDALMRGMARRLRAADDTIDRMQVDFEEAPVGQIHAFAPLEALSPQ
jgi:CRP/FNR family transcriptional regulator, cyclic AMP receptor protein